MSANRLICRHFCDKKPFDDNYVKPLSGVKRFISRQFFRFIESYERVLEERFPKTFKIYRVFTIGAKDFYGDVVQYLQISKQLFDGRRVHELTYNELMVYMRTPKDMARVGPVLLVSALPFANYVVFPLAYWFPKQLLSSHFWTLEQRQTFQTMHHKKRLYHFRPVFRCIQSRLPFVTSEDNLREKCGLVFAALGSGTHPSVDHILDMKPVFRDKPYGMQYLKSKHLTELCRMYGLNAFPLGKRSRLINHIGFVRELDLAIDRTGIESLNLDQIKTACFMRGLNPIELSKEEMIAWLQTWIGIAHKVDSNYENTFT